MDILTYRWDHLQDILDIHQKPMLPASHPYVKSYIKWAYTINTAKGFYRKSDTADDLLLYDGATERVVFRHVDFHPCKKYHDLLFLFLRGPKLYYVLDSRGILFEFTDYVSNIYEQPSLTAQIDLDKGYYLVCGKLKMSFRDKTLQSDYIERTKADYGALFNKEYNCFIRQNVHNTNRYLYLTCGNSKCGRFLELFIKNGMAYERLPNILVDDETVNIRIPLFGTNAARKDVQFLFAKYNNTYAIQSIPITELCGGMNLPWETGDKYSAQFYMPPGKQVLVFAVINTLRNIFSDADDYTIFKKTMGKMFRQFEKSSSTEVNNEFLELLLMHLMLIHQSGSNDTEVYKALCQGVKDGKLRSIGISNYYTLEEYERVTSGGEIKPAVVQNENHVEYDKQGKMAMEIDFLIRIDRKIVPIEAKSGKQYTTKSLLKFKEKFTNKVGKQYVLHEGDLRVEGEVVYLPYYMAAIL